MNDPTENRHCTEFLTLIHSTTVIGQRNDMLEVLWGVNLQLSTVKSANRYTRGGEVGLYEVLEEVRLQGEGSEQTP